MLYNIVSELYVSVPSLSIFLFGLSIFPNILMTHSNPSFCSHNPSPRRIPLLITQKTDRTTYVPSHTPYLPVFIFILIKSPNSFLQHQKQPALSSNPRNTQLRSGQEYHAPRHHKNGCHLHILPVEVTA